MFKVKLTSRGEQQVRAIHDRETEKIATEIFRRSQENLEAADKIDTGELFLSGNLEVSSPIKRVIYTAPHAPYVELGIPPTKLPVGEVQVGTKTYKVPLELYRWAQRKLGLSEKEARSAAWAIWTKISKEGIDESPYLAPAIAIVRNEYK